MTQIDDPHAQREAQKYDSPIPSREFILQHLEERGEPISYQVLCKELLLFDADAQEAICNVSLMQAAAG